MKKTSNAEHRTPNTELQRVATFGVRCSAFGVRREILFRAMDLFRHNILYRLLDFIVGGIFIYAGLIKVMDPVAFARDIDNYHMLPWAIGLRLAFYLPWLEMLCGLALIFRFLYRGGLSILMGLTFTFIAASIISKARGLDITCGCFGHASKNWSFTTHLALDLALLAAVFLLWFSDRRTASGALALQGSNAEQKL